MQPGKYEFRSDFARQYYGAGREEGREEGRLHEARALLSALVARRLDAVDDDVRRRIDACGDLSRLHDLVVDVGAAPDRATVEELLARL